MKLWPKKNGTPRSGSPDLFARCEGLFAASRRLVNTEPDSCAESTLNLVPPDGAGPYVLCYYSSGPYYSLFPPERRAGHGSFIYPGGGFTRHGRIGPDEAEHIITTFTPAA